MNNFKTTIIITIYKDLDNLPSLLHAISQQLNNDDEVIITEDNNDPAINSYLSENIYNIKNLKHISQEDDGFRKNRALNRAIAEAIGDYLIFLDGDCIPHKKFIESHKQAAEEHYVCAGRRAEFGTVTSAILKKSPITYHFISNPFIYILLWPFFFIEGVKNYEVGLRSMFLYNKTQKRKIKLLGCNFSCFKNDIISINGFDEDYKLYGTGEDSDFEYRLNANNVSTKNIKFLAPVYHLHHVKKVGDIPENIARFERTKKSGKLFCENGINKYL